jgi:gas vesicle structural protein
MAQAYQARTPRSSGLYEVLDLILDKGLVIDAYVRVSLVGIEILTIDARIVVASVDTYLRFAEAVNRLELGGGESTQKRGLPEVMGELQEGGARSKTRGALSGVGESVSSALQGDRGEQREGPGLLGRAKEAVQESLGGERGDEADDEQADAGAGGQNETGREQRGGSPTDSRAPQEGRRPPQRRGGRS